MDTTTIVTKVILIQDNNLTIELPIRNVPKDIALNHIIVFHDIEYMVMIIKHIVTIRSVTEKHIYVMQDLD